MRKILVFAIMLTLLLLVLSVISPYSIYATHMSSMSSDIGVLSSGYDPKLLKDGSITRDGMLIIAEAYKTHKWIPTDENVFHGICLGSQVDTPDIGYEDGWWIPNEENTGVPYQWGGFSSLSGLNLVDSEDFDEQYRGQGEFAGDIHYAGDIYCLKPGECPEACGVDCSGFVGRCWNLSKPKPSTTNLAQWEFAWPIKFDQMRRGGILNCPGAHVILFKEFVTPDDRNTPGKTKIRVYEASGKDWKVSEWEYTLKTIKSAEEEWHGIRRKTNVVTLEISGRIDPVDGTLETILSGFSDGLEYIPRTYNPIKWALVWLREHQRDGSWQNSVGITSMAALAFLNAGYDENDPTVSSAIQYILANRRGDGSFGWGTYETSTAVWALVATHNPDYHDETAQAKDWLILAQYDEVEGATAASPCYGGWRYGSSPSDGDLSNTQFALMALDAAYSELGLEKPDPNDPNGWSFKAITFISRCQNRPASNDQPWAHDTTRPSYNDGGFIYHPGGWSLAGGTDSYGSMTAAGIWSLRLCGVAVTDERVQAGLNWLVNNEDCGFDDNPGHPYDQAHCFLYYYYMTIAKALTMCFLHDLGEVDWYAALSARLLQLQYDDGHWVNAPASHGWEDVPELATDYALLALQVKQPPPAKLWMSIILASNAELCVYDPQGRHARLDDVAIPGATFEIDKEGRQIVNLTELEAGKYAIELTGTADGDYSLTINGYRDEEQTFSKTFEGTIKKGQTLVGSALVTSMVGALTIYTEKPMPPPDTIPPTTLLTIGEPKYVTEVTYVTPDTPFNLTAADNPGGTGVALTAYKIRNVTYDSGWLTYTEPFRLTGLIDSVYSIDYNSTDNANNVEPTQTVTVTLFSWNYVFEDTYGRGTILKINIAHKFFQFITPDKDYGITNATNMRLCGRAIIIKHCDSELRLITVAVDTKLDLCVAIAWDKQTRKQYILIDKPGIEE